MTITLQSSNKVFGGEVRKYTHASASTGTDMTFSVYVPPPRRCTLCPWCTTSAVSPAPTITPYRRAAPSARAPIRAS